MRSLVLSVAVPLVVMGIGQGTTLADTFTWEEPLDDFRVVTTGSYKGLWGSQAHHFVGVGAVKMTISFDWSEPSMTYEAIELAFPGGSFSMTEEFTVAPGATKAVETIIDIDPVVVAANDFGPIPLIPGRDGDYYIKEVYPAAFPDPLTVTGTYHISGPTESAAGAFAFTRDVDEDSSYRFPDYPRLETSWYPESLSLWGGSYAHWGWDAAPYDIDEIVDGVHIQIGFRGVQFKMGPLIIPEPSSFVVLGMGAVSLLVYALRKGCSVRGRPRQIRQ